MYTKSTDTDYRADQIQALKEALKYGHRKQIATRLSKSVSHVDKVFNGVYTDDRVFDIAIEILAKETAAKQLKQDKIDKALRAMEVLQDFNRLNTER